MSDQEQPELTRAGLRTPRSAAVAGIVFAVLFGIAMVVFQTTIPEGNDPIWLKERSGVASFGVALIPFAGIAFLWFIGVLRDRLGDLEDRFFSTVFFGSGLLFLATVFVWAALLGAAITATEFDPTWPDTDSFTYVAAVIAVLAGTFSLRMAGVFVISISTVWLRTQVMPRWIVILSYALAVVLLVGADVNRVLRFVFPAWVLLISVMLLIWIRRNEPTD